MITLSSQEPSQEDVSKALENLQTAGYTWVDEDENNIEHLQRHAPDNATIGSKFSVAAWNDIGALRKQARNRCVVDMAQALAGGQPLRVETSIAYPGAGTDGVISVAEVAALSTHGRANIVRDPGTRYEQPLEVVVVAADQALPGTDKVIAVAGPYGDTGQVGMYTMFPGNSSRPFAKEGQSPEDYAANQKYWEDHVFMSTTTQAVVALNGYLDVLRAAPDSSEADIRFQEEEIQRFSNLQSKPVDEAGFGNRLASIRAPNAQDPAKDSGFSPS